MSEDTAQSIVNDAVHWWTTSIIDIHPGEIDVRGYPIEQLIGAISFPQMIWLMVRGELPTQGQAHLLEAALVASVDHGPQAPSIATARMAVTCGAELNNAMASAVNMLGKIHGGAGQECMQLYALARRHLEAGLAIDGAAEAAIDEYAAAHGKIIPGFGHRWHPADPRTAPLLELVERARDAGEVSGQYVSIARSIEGTLARRKGKPIPINIDGSTAVIFSELGFEPEMGRGLFVLSRSVGILAHAYEQMQQSGRIKGPMPKSIPFTYSGPERRLLDLNRSQEMSARTAPQADPERSD